MDGCGGPVGFIFHCCVSSEDITLSIELSPRFGIFLVIRSSVGFTWYDELQCDFRNEPTQLSCNHTVEIMEIMEIMG